MFMKRNLLIALLVLYSLAGNTQNIILEQYASGFTSPVAMAHAGDARVFIVERQGSIKIINSDATVLTTKFLDISSSVKSTGGEQGLLGLAFHPDYATNGFFYVNYTNSSNATVIARYTVSADPNIADAGSESIIMTIPQPYANNNGGSLVFGQDGYLYIGMGDGGAGGDPGNRAQNRQELLGKILRIDVDSGSPYSIPADNPFASDPSVLDEIWAIGLRNPWKFTFDSQTGDMWIPDVGQGNFEEINMIENGLGGQNFGWRCYEASAAHNTSNCEPIGFFNFPIAEYAHTPYKCAIIGGYVYHGTEFPAMIGKYFFADYCGEVGAVDPSNSFSLTFFVGVGGGITTFGENTSGDLFAAKIDGRIYKLKQQDIVWTGTSSTDWNTATNWSTSAVPTATDNVVIPSALQHYPHVTLDPVSPAVCADLTVESGATLTIDAGKALTVSGATDNEGTILVESLVTGTGSLITNGTVSGNGSFSMMQYLTGSGGSTPDGLFYYVSNPAVGATADTYDAGFGKVWSADETTQSYTEITSSTTVLNPMQGYVARMGVPGAPTLSGTSFNTGNQSATGLTRTGIAAVNRGYSLAGNPYPSTVSWDAATKTNLETTMWYRTHQGSTMLYDTYNATGSIGTNNNGSGAVTGDIPPTQAFWVRVDADGNTGQLDFTNAMRSHGTLAGIYRMAAEEGTVRITLSNGSVSDQTIVVFDAAALDSYDNYDSQKFWAGASVPQLYTTVGTDSLVINGLNSIVTNPIVDLGVKLPEAGEYTFDATSITLNENVHLEDRLLGIFQDLNAEPTYAFTSTVAGNIPTRFALHFGMSITGIEDATSNVGIYSFGKQVTILLNGTSTGTVEVLDMAGRMVHTQNLNSAQTIIDLSTASGIYLVRVATEGNIITRKVSIQ
jgi:glucose/arabinose dehydrogenase